MLDLDSEAILKAIESQHGLVVERARGIYSFSHLTFQEYFTAKYIVDSQKKLSLPTLVKQHFLDPKWREVWLLTTEMLTDAEELVVAMHQQISQRGAHPGVSLFLKKADELIVKRDGRLPSDEIRIWATALPLIVSDSLARVRARARVSARDLASALARTSARDRDRTSARARARDLVRARDLDLDLDLDLDAVGDLAFALLSYQNDDAVSFSEDDLYAIADYFHSWEMLAFCLNTECYVSTETRKQVMGNFLQNPSQESET